METFHIDCIISNPFSPKKSISVKKLMVDTGAEYSWIPREKLEKVSIKVRKKDVPFIMVNGQQISRNVGYALIRSGEFETVDEVVFAEKEDLKLLGSRTLEGFAAVVDARRKKLTAAGPLPVA